MPVGGAGQVTRTNRERFDTRPDWVHPCPPPGEVADTDLRLRAVELKREQAKLELDAIAREIDRLKTAKAELEELKATLEKELKAKNDK